MTTKQAQGGRAGRSGSHKYEEPLIRPISLGMAPVSKLACKDLWQREDWQISAAEERVDGMSAGGELCE